jgi:predicted amidophosphoribosyltransferase
VDGVAAVPSNAYKTLHRGFVPALPFAQYFESSLGITDYSSCLHKKLFSFHQKNKNRIRRLSSDPFWISDFNKASKAGHQQHPPKHMLLLDDVITTGASINQLAKHLKKQGVKKVFALSVAHTPRYL